MTEYNLLTQPLIAASPQHLTLPGVLAALAQDTVESFDALRPHQNPAWHMFLVQLAALTLHRAARNDLPTDEATWTPLLRALTLNYPDDEPWCLVVDDWTKPAFLQPPVPKGVTLSGRVATADALDLLITSKNHDLKQQVARAGVAQDWLFALVSLQTGEGFGGAGNYGIARMNGGSSSRPMLGFSPLPAPAGRNTIPRRGPHFVRDVQVLLATRESEIERHSHLGYPKTGGIGLTWLEPWAEGAQLRLQDLDIWFIDICRRVRISAKAGVFSATRGNSKATRIDAKAMNGVLGDPWAPVHLTEHKSFTLGSGDFDYRTLVRLLFGTEKGAEWTTPILAKTTATETGTMALIATALARGKSKTEGFKSRILPVGGNIAQAWWTQRQELFKLASAQMKEIGYFDKALTDALVLVAARGERNNIKKPHYERTRDARDRLDRVADTIFFDHLWKRFEARDIPDAPTTEERAFRQALWAKTQTIFRDALPAIPCPNLLRPRAWARAKRTLDAEVRKRFPELFDLNNTEEANHVA